MLCLTEDKQQRKPVRCLEIQTYSGFFILYMYLVMVGYKIFLEGGQKMAEVHDLFGTFCLAHI